MGVITVGSKEELKGAANAKYDKIYLAGDAEEALIKVFEKNRSKRKVTGATSFASFLAAGASTAAFPPFILISLASLLFGVGSTRALSKYNLKMTSDNRYYLERKNS
jgi:hypothetical protein